jgi:TldD protein
LPEQTVLRCSIKGIALIMSMKQIGDWALNTATSRGATYAEARIVDLRERSLATKNGKIASASDGESMGVGIRVIAAGGWGFSATEDLTREGVERCAAHAVEIARASAKVKAAELRLAAENPAVVE